MFIVLEEAGLHSIQSEHPIESWRASGLGVSHRAGDGQRGPIRNRSGGGVGWEGSRQFERNCNVKPRR